MKSPLNPTFTNATFFFRSSVADVKRFLLKGWGVKVVSLLLVVMVVGGVWGQVTSWSLSSTTTSATTVTANTTASSVIVSSGTIVYQAAPSYIYSSPWATSSTFSTSGKYWQVTITPNTNYQISVTAFSFNAGRTPSGPASVDVQYSLNGFSSAGTSILSGGSNSNTSSLTTISANASLPISNTANAITFRIWGYNASSTGNFRINNITISGSASATTIAPLAPTITSITPSNQQLSVAFTAGGDGGSAITNYKYSTDGGANWQTRAAGTTASPMVISTLSTDGTTALTNGTSYNVQIKAVNAIGDGTATASTAATPFTLPGAPTITAATAGNTTASVSFTAGSTGGSPITGYTVTSNPDGLTNSGATSPITVSGLTNGTAYTFTVTAANAAGTGAASAASSSVTPTSGPTVPNAPTSLAATLGNASASVAFTAPFGGGSAITAYTVSSNPGNITGTGSTSPVTVNGLTNGTAYTFTAVATNSVGNSLASSASNSVTPATTPDAPTITSITPSNTQLSVAFTAGATGGSVITNYKYSTDGGSTFTAVSPAATTSPITITGLSNGTSYSVQIKAVNAIGDGTATASTASTPATTPSAPTISSISSGNGQLSVAFTAGANGGSAITNYKYSTNGGSTFTVVLPAATTSPITITGLTNGTSYYVQIKAVNAIGDGTATVNSAGTPATTPSASTITSITPANGQLTVNFTAGGTGGSVITNYKYSTDGGTTFTAVSPAATISPITITGLSNGTSYNVQIKAVNAIGDGTATSSTSGTPSLFCASTGPSTQGSDYFTNFTTTGGTSNINNTSTFSANGYGNFTAQTVTQYQGGTINYSAISPGIGDGSTFSIFIDWNQDGDFTDSGEEVVAIGVSTQIVSNPSGSFTVLVGATPGNTRMRIIIKDAAGAITSCNSALANSETEDYAFNIVAASTPPALSAASSPTVDAAFNVTFTDNATWRSSITSVTIGGTTLTAGFVVTAGQITFTPSASAPASLLQSSGSKSVVVIATGYASATVTQAIGFGAATKLGISTQPTAPASNGAVLAQQPLVAIQDQYGNTVTSDNSTIVTAAVSAGSWTIGGTLVKTAVSGVVTFTNITASSASAVASASIGFTSNPTYTTAISTPPFAIPSPDYISLTGLGIASTENFNSLTTSSTSISGITGFLYQTGSSPTWSGGSSTSFTAVNSGSPTSGDNYIWGNTLGNDFSVGVMTSGSYGSPNSLMTKYKNNTGSTINNLLLGYDLKRYRINSASASVQFFYSLDGISWNAVTNCDIPSSALITGTSSYSYSPSGTPSITNHGVVSMSNVAISGLTITDGSNVFLRWNLNTTGVNSQGIGIDNVSLKPCNNLPSTSNLSLAVASTIAGNGAVVTVTSSTLADGNYTVTSNVSGTNTVSSTTATMTFASGTGTFTTSVLSNTGSANVVNVSSIAFTSLTGCASTVSASSAAFNTLSPLSTISNTQFTSARDITRGTTELPIYRFQVDVTNVAATLSSLGFTTPVTVVNGNSNYVNTDVTNFKAFLTTSTTFSNAIQLGATSPSGKTQQNAGETLINFTSLATTLNVGTTYYIWLTADVLSAAVAGRTITVNAPTVGISGTVSGTNSATGTQTIISVATNYYLNAGGSLTTSAHYFTSPNGVGTSLSAAGLSYTSNDVTLNIPSSVANTSDFTLGNGSKIVVQSGGSLTVGSSNTIAGTIDVNDGGTLTVNNTSISHTLGTLGSTSSTVIYSASGNQAIAAKPYANLTISGSGVKTIGVGTATVSGTLSLNAATLDISSNTLVTNGLVSQSNGIIDADAGTLTFGNSADMSLLSTLFSGTIYNLSKSSGAGTLTLNDDFSITNNLSTSASTGALVLAATKQLTIGGIITNNGTLTIENGATLVQTGTGANSGSGTYNVKQNITGSGGSTPNGRFWYLGGALSDASSTALLSSTGNQLWQWNEANFGYAVVTSGQTLTQGKSYVLRSGQVETINFSGSSLSNGTVTVSGLTRTGTSQNYRGCHLVSNPYPSYLDWNAITKSNIGTTMYIRTAIGATLDVMETFNSSGSIATTISSVPLTQYIAPMQGFWVKVAADGQTGSLTMNNSLRSHQSSGSGLRSTAQDFPAFLRFNMLDGQNKDQVILLMSPDAAMSIDDFDSEKMPASGYAQFYSTVNAKKLVINGMKNVKAKTSVPLTLDLPSSKSYTFQAEEFHIEDGLILLEDKQEGVIQDLTINPTYSFFGNAGNNATRFVVHFQLATAPVLVGGPQELESLGSDELTTDNIQIVSNNQGAVIIRLSEGFKPEGSIRIFDASGRLVEQTDFKDQETTIQLNEQAGLYFVEVNTGKLMVKKKIVIN